MLKLKSSNALQLQVNGHCNVKPWLWHSCKTEIVKLALWGLHIKCLGHAKHCWVLQPVAAAQWQTHPREASVMAWGSLAKGPSWGQPWAADPATLTPSGAICWQIFVMQIKRREATTESSAAPRVLQRGPGFTLMEKTRIWWFQRSQEQLLGKNSMRPTQVKSPHKARVRGDSLSYR